MIDYIKNPIVLFLVLSFIITLILFISGVKRYKKLSKVVNILCIIFNFIYLCGSIVIYEITVIKKITINTELDLLFILFVLSAASLLLTIIANVLKGNLLNKYNFQLIESVVFETSEFKVLLYLNNMNKVIDYTPYFFNELNIKGSKKWYEDITNIVLNGETIDYSSFVEALKDMNNIDNTITFVFNSFEKSFVITKEPVIINEVVEGYVVYSKDHVMNQNIVDGFSLVIDELNLPYAYYNDDSTSIVYTFNSEFKRLLGLHGRMVSYEDLKRLVYTEDLETFYQASSNMSKDGTFFYRMKTSNGIKLFEEIKKYNGEHVTSMITLAPNESISFIDRITLSKDIDEMIAKKMPFGGMLISLNGFIETYNTLGPIVSKELVNKYVEFLKKEVINSNDLICKVSDIEYILIFKDLELMDKVVRDITNNTSIVLSYEFNYGEEVIKSNNNIGIVYADETIVSSIEFINGLENALSFTNEVNYDKSYSIFQTKDLNSMKVNKTKTKDLNSIYSFDDYKINIDNSFLDEEE